LAAAESKASSMEKVKNRMNELQIKFRDRTLSTY